MDSQNSPDSIVSTMKGKKFPTKYDHSCNRCGYDWLSKTKSPGTCANQKCRSPYWNKIRVRPNILGGQDNCQVCNSHLYSLYAGGAKERVENMYYCNGCQKFIELDYAIKRNGFNDNLYNYNNNIITENDAVADLEHEIALTFDIEVEG